MYVRTFIYSSSTSAGITLPQFEHVAPPYIGALLEETASKMYDSLMDSGQPISLAMLLADCQQGQDSSFSRIVMSLPSSQEDGYLAVTPWNRPTIQSPRRYSGCGRALLKFAVQRSDDLGYEGRVGLHSLPRSRPFYKGSGFMDLGPDEAEGGLNYFEYPD